MRRPELIVIADDRGRSSLPKAITSAPVRIIDCFDARNLSSSGEAALLIDVDLKDFFKVKLIKENLPDRAHNQCRIVAVDRGSHFCEIQAKGLGASDLLKRPLDIRELKECLWRHTMLRPPNQDLSSAADQDGLAQAPGGVSIASAAAALDHIFTGLICGGPLDAGLAEQAGREVLEAISDIGLAKWLGTVRRYHEGTFQHCLTVTGVITAFGHKTGMRRSDIMTLTIAGLLHDIGKAQVPLAILDKPGKLTDEEFALVKQHPMIGYDYVRTQGRLSAEILKAIRHHHEYLDGSGYPDGLTAENIDDLTRIMTVCDVYGALVEQRAYKAPKSAEAAVNILTGMAKQGKVELDLVKALARCVGPL
jgi:putative nucleotidyltransferase with HDIG domain